MTTPNILSADVIRTALSQMKPRPSVEMYPGDWLRDAISGCSLAANGLWWRMTMVMHDGKPYGHMVANNGTPIPENQMAQRCGARNIAEWRKVLAELEAAGIPGRTGDEEYRKILTHEPIEVRGIEWTLDLSPLAIEPTGILYSRRMMRDRILSLVRFLVSPKGQSLIPSLTEALSSQTPAFVRDARARSAEDEDDSVSPVQPSKKPEGVQGEVSPLRVVTPDFAAIPRLQPHIDAAGFTYPPSDQIVIAWLSEYGEELILETLADCGPSLRGKHYRYLESILTNRRNNPNERPGNRRKRVDGRPPAGDPGASAEGRKVSAAAFGERVLRIDPDTGDVSTVRQPAPTGTDGNLRGV
jgi:hypothetical protein